MVGFPKYLFDVFLVFVKLPYIGRFRTGIDPILGAGKNGVDQRGQNLLSIPLADILGTQRNAALLGSTRLDLYDTGKSDRLTACLSAGSIFIAHYLSSCRCLSASLAFSTCS